MQHKYIFYSILQVPKFGVAHAQNDWWMRVFISYVNWTGRPHNCPNILLCTCNSGISKWGSWKSIKFWSQFSIIKGLFNNLINNLVESQQTPTKKAHFYLTIIMCESGYCNKDSSSNLNFICLIIKF